MKNTTDRDAAIKTPVRYDGEIDNILDADGNSLSFQRICNAINNAATEVQADEPMCKCGHASSQHNFGAAKLNSPCSDCWNAIGAANPCQTFRLAAKPLEVLADRDAMVEAARVLKCPKCNHRAPVHGDEGCAICWQMDTPCYATLSEIIADFALAHRVGQEDEWHPIHSADDLPKEDGSYLVMYRHTPKDQSDIRTGPDQYWPSVEQFNATNSAKAMNQWMTFREQARFVAWRKIEPYKLGEDR